MYKNGATAAIRQTTQHFSQHPASSLATMSSKSGPKRKREDGDDDGQPPKYVRHRKEGLTVFRKRKGNNPAGAKGFRKCQRCRDQKQKVQSPFQLTTDTLKCEYPLDDPSQPCSLCTRMLAPCGPKIHTIKNSSFTSQSHGPRTMASQSARLIGQTFNPSVIQDPVGWMQETTGPRPPPRISDIAGRLERDNPTAGVDQIYQWTGEEMRRLQTSMQNPHIMVQGAGQHSQATMVAQSMLGDPNNSRSHSTLPLTPQPGTPGPAPPPGQYTQPGQYTHNPSNPGGLQGSPQFRHPSNPGRLPHRSQLRRPHQPGWLNPHSSFSTSGSQPPIEYHGSSPNPLVPLPYPADPVFIPHANPGQPTGPGPLPPQNYEPTGFIPPTQGDQTAPPSQQPSRYHNHPDRGQGQPPGPAPSLGDEDVENEGLDSAHPSSTSEGHWSDEYN